MHSINLTSDEDYALAGIEDILNGYYKSYEMIAKDIREGIDEGFSEGFREGLKQGFIEGIKECISKGFDQIKVEDMNQVLMHTLENCTSETASAVIKRDVSNEYWGNIRPSFKQEMEDAYYKTVEEIKNADLDVGEKSAFYIKSCVDLSAKKIVECVGNVCDVVRPNSPTDVIFKNFYYCLQDEFNRDLDKNLKAYEKMICTEIDKKINCERLDHERH